MDAISKVGYATSSDGVTWSYFENNPVFANVSGNTLSLVGVINFGGDYKLYYQDGTGLRLATSPDGVSWSDYPENPIISADFSGGVGGLAVHKLDGKVVIFIGGKIGDSTDGIHFNISPGLVTPLLPPDSEPAKPYAALVEDGVFRIWYPRSMGLVNCSFSSTAVDTAVAQVVMSPSYPTASAGPDQSVREGTLVQLSGSASDPHGEAITYEWTQLPGGPPVNLSDATVPNPSFTAPFVADNQTLTFQLVARNASGLVSEADTVDIGVQQYNTPPIANAGPDSTIKEGATKTLDGRASYDLDAGDSITSYHWMQTAGMPVTLFDYESVNPSFVAPVGDVDDVLTFSLAVSDNKEIGEADSVDVRVVANSPPVADAGLDQTKDENATVTLNGNASYDPDADEIQFQWTQVGDQSVALVNSNTATPSFVAPRVPPGGASLMFLLSVTDTDPVNPLSTTDTVVVNLLNTNDPPDCDLASPSVSRLWPPNHTMVSVSIDGVSDPNANDEITITGVTQDEPVNGLGDGDTSPDAVILRGTPTNTVLLRAERAGKGDGRVYRVSFTASDEEGACSRSLNVTVPQNSNRAAVDNGQTVDSSEP